MRTLGRASGYVGVCLVFVSCERSPSPAPTTSSSAIRAPAPHQVAPVTSTSRPQPPVSCRAIKVSGDVTDAQGRKLSRGATLGGDSWLTLAKAASVVVRHASSTREYALEGPSQVLPCHGGLEEVLLLSGTLRAAPGGGARAGAFVTIATPLGTVRYGNADVSVQAKSRQVEVEVNSGSVWVEPAEPARLEGKPKLTGPKAKGRLVSTSAPDAGQLVARCEKAAKDSEAKAKSLFAGSSTAGLGRGAAAHMKLRSAARLSCLIAEASLGLANQPELAKTLTQRLEQANQGWQRVPPRPGKGPPRTEQK